METLENAVGNMGVGSSAAEMIVVFLVLLAVSTGFWLLIGRYRLYNILINIYIASALLWVAPAKAINIFPGKELTAFFLVVVVLTIVDRFMFDLHFSGSGPAYWRVVVMSFLITGLLASILGTFWESKELHRYVSKDTTAYFIGPWARLVWMSLPLLFIVAINKKDG
ncbi:MAG TPA: hypothetical protein PKA31_03790 [Candidatus Moranbacteria bacterium]|nr:hypothetical protein [Candidatus Moranbacteria bacterium]